MKENLLSSEVKRLASCARLIWFVNKWFLKYKFINLNNGGSRDPNMRVNIEYNICHGDLLYLLLIYIWDYVRFYRRGSQLL